MKWIGQHIWDFISRFRNSVYLESVTEHIDDDAETLVKDNTTGLVQWTKRANAGRVHLYVKAMEDLKAGHTVYASGAVGNSGAIEVNKYIANNTIDERRFVGIIESDIDTGEFGYAITIGTLKGIDTTGAGITEAIGETWLEGDILFVSDTYAGEMTKVQPAAPNQVIPCAFVLKKNANGTIAIRAYDLGYHLGELHDLQITTPTEGEVLRYNDTDDIWENTDSLVIDASGNVGIGTTSPSTKLHIEDSSHVYSTLQSTGANTEVAHKYRSSTLTSGYYWWTGLNNYDKYQIGYGTSFDNAGTALCIDTSGNVGIGTTSPSAKLEVSADGTTSQEIAHFGNSNGIGKIKMQLDGVGSSKQVMLDASNNEDIVLNTQGDSYITDNLGIGTSSPSEKLHVDGNAIITGDLTVQGTTVTIDTTNLNVEDKNITLNYSTGDSSALADGAGITIQDAVDASNDATMLWNASLDRFDFSHPITTKDNITFVTSSGTDGGLIDMDSNDDLVISNPLGDVLIGDGSSDIYVGDGINNVDILFEQSGTISAESVSATLTLGGAGGSLAIQSPTVNGTSYFTGSVGIGVASPGSTLHVNGDVRAEDFLCRNSTDTLTVGYLQENSSGEGVLRINNGSNWGLIARGISNSPVVGAWYNGSLTFRGFGASDGDTDVNDVDVMTVDFANQRVGIGTTSPSEKLHVNGNGLFNGGLTVGDSAADTFITRGHTYLATTGNNVGIGTTSPSAKLEVSGDSSYSSDLNIFSISGTKTGGTAVTSVKGINVDIGSNDHVTGYDIANLYGAYINNNASGSSATVINNWYGVYVPAVDANRVSNSVSAYFGDNVGIGTSSPTERLHVKKDNATHLLNLETDYDTSRSVRGQLSWRDSVNITGGIWTEYDGTMVSMSFGNLYNSGYNTNTSMTIRGNGNVGIGTTSPVHKLDLKTNPAIGFYHSDGTYQGLIGDGASAVSGGGTYDIGFRANASGNLLFAAGGSTERMRIDTSGNVGIGTSSPTDKLDVAGAIRLTQDVTFSYSNAGRIYKDAGHGLTLHGVAGTSNNFAFATPSGQLMITNPAGTNNVNIVPTASSANVGIGTSSPSEKLEVRGNIKIGDTDILKIGTSDDLTLTHNGTDSYVVNETGDLYIDNNQDDGNIIFRSDDNSGGLTEYFRLNGADKRIKVQDGVRFVIGTGSDLQLYHNSTNSFIENTNGDLTISNLADDKDIIFQCDDGAGGVATYFQLDGSLGYTVAKKQFLLDDNVQLSVGTSEHGINMIHDGSNSTMSNAIGDLTIVNYQNDGDIIFNSDDGSGGTTEYFRVDGGDEKVVFSKDVDVTGDVVASGTLIAKQYQAFQCNFINDISTTKYYLPLDTVTAQTVRYQDEACMLAHADGRLASVTLKVENLNGASGNITFGIEVLQSTGTGYSGTWTVVETETMAISSTHNHDVFHFHFSTAKHFDSTHMFAISIQSDNAALGGDGGNDERWFVTPVIEWDYNTYLGTNGTSTRYDTTP